MAVENLYNTAVEYHSPLAAKPPPPTHKPGPFLLKAQLSKHILLQDHLCSFTREQQVLRHYIWKIQAAFSLVVMDLASCLLLCVTAHSHHHSGACGYILQMLTHTQIFLKWFLALVKMLKMGRGTFGLFEQK